MKEINLKHAQTGDIAVKANGTSDTIVEIVDSTFGNDRFTYYVKLEGNLDGGHTYYHNSFPKFIRKEYTIIDILRNGASIF